MPAPICRKTRTLGKGRARASWLPAAACAALLLAVGVWIAAGRVATYVATDDARLEMDRTAYAIGAPTSARVTAVRVTLGQEVEVGAVLFELEAEEEAQRLAEARAYQEALRVERAALALRQNAGARRAAQAERVGGASVEGVAQELARLDGEIAATTTTVARLEHELALRRITTPVSGSVGELAELSAGTLVSAGDRLASVMTSGQLRAIARFTASNAAGRVAPGQSAQLRLDGSQSARYRVVEAVVAGVASEPQGGLVRVELELAPGTSLGVPLQHGLTGSAEVRVERLSPAALVFRHAGKFLQVR